MRRTQKGKENMRLWRIGLHSCETGEVTIHCSKLIIMPRTLPTELQRCKRNNWQFMNTGTNLTRLKYQVKELLKLAEHVIENYWISCTGLLNDSWKWLQLVYVVTGEWQNTEHWRVYTDRGKPKHGGGGGPVPVPLVHRKPRMSWDGTRASAVRGSEWACCCPYVCMWCKELFCARDG
jgi:hypothetical protein